jgi:hypothetical protein
MPSSPPTRPAARAPRATRAQSEPVRVARSGSLPVSERDAMYRDNADARDAAPLPAGTEVDTLRVSALGLEQGTISRLVRAGWLLVGDVLRAPPEALWRSVGRHGIADLIARLDHHGLPQPEMSDYERWRLGLVERREIAVPLTVDTPLADLWPMLGTALGEALASRGFLCVGDLAPRDDDALLALYRLGKVNLRKILAVLDAAVEHADPARRPALEAGMRAIQSRSAPGRRRAEDPSRPRATLERRLRS